MAERVDDGGPLDGLGGAAGAFAEGEGGLLRLGGGGRRGGSGPLPRLHANAHAQQHQGNRAEADAQPEGPERHGVHNTPACVRDALDSSSPRRAWGLLGMQERASLMNARLFLDSTPGDGSTLTVLLEKSAYDKEVDYADTGIDY